MGIALVLIAIVVTRRLVRNDEDIESELRTSEERFEYAILAEQRRHLGLDLAERRALFLGPLRIAAGLRAWRTAGDARLVPAANPSARPPCGG